ncbi:MAG TPA: hypothetical protein PLH70_01475 [Bacteroidales bacterium]|nr:hypothetical protein [Bacteroidales bacterium]HOH22221.1 hypothetical protein [Bacteroidales bacterium]HPB57326.1 hypothetical protein [Bacteroidales bacterium]HPZ02646.1 hypothetical protein [Bacteroidales bacterium]HQB74455.1 hypothetical protein [Bacteroidales bacterium]
MKKTALIVLVLIFSFHISAQVTEHYSYVSTFDLKDSTKYKHQYHREYITENIFIDSIFLRNGATYKKNEKNEWFIKDGSRWTLFFNEKGMSNYVGTDGSFNTVLHFKKTKLTCNGSPIYYVTVESPDEDCILIDVPDYYFTPKDGFIIITRLGFYYIREDLIPYFKDYITNDRYLDMISIPFFLDSDQ